MQSFRSCCAVWLEALDYTHLRDRTLLPRHRSPACIVCADMSGATVILALAVSLVLRWTRIGPTMLPLQEARMPDVAASMFCDSSAVGMNRYQRYSGRVP